MDGINAAKLMDLFNAQTGTVNTLWNIFAAVTLGILGFVLKEKDLRENWRLKIAFTVAFILFALGNVEAISRSQAILVAIADTLHRLPALDAHRAVYQAYQAPSVREIRIGHHVVTALVVLVMWVPDLVTRLGTRRGAE